MELWGPYLNGLKNLGNCGDFTLLIRVINPVYNWEGPTFQGLSPRAMLDPLILTPWLEKDVLLVQHKGFIPTKGLRNWECKWSEDLRRHYGKSQENKPWIFQFGCCLNLKGWCIGTPYHPFSTPWKIQEPVCPLFWWMNPPKQGFFQSKQGSCGFQVSTSTFQGVPIRP